MTITVDATPEISFVSTVIITAEPFLTREAVR